VKTIKANKAQKLNGKPAESIRIELGEEFPTNLSLEKSRSLFKKQGELLAASLWMSLPGGTVDALIIALLTRKHSSLIVRMPEP